MEELFLLALLSIFKSQIIMKSNELTFMMYSLLLLSMLSCGNNEITLPPIACNQPDLEVNQKVEDVRGAANSIASPYKFNDVIEAYVVSTDEFGNFFKTISFQTLATSTAPAIGFSVPVDVTNTYIDYRPGNKVYIKLQNLYTDIYYGGLRIGNLFVNSLNEGGIGRLSQNEYKKVLHASCTTLKESELIRQISLNEIESDLLLNTLVEVADVQFAQEAIGRNFYESANDVGGATNWILEDRLGNKLICRTSSFAEFSSKKVPSGSGKVKGILTKFGTNYQLIPRSEYDFSLSAKRNIPFFSENFESVVDNVNVNLPGWANIVQNGSLLWKGSVYSGNSCAEYAISGTRVALNVGWLISPKIDMDIHTNEILTFRAAQHNLTIDSPLNSLEVFVSSNFNGTNVATATWIPLKAKLPTQSTPWYQFVGSGGIDLSSFKGKINIGFRYRGEGRNPALDGTFQIDDVQIYGDK